MTAPEMEVVGVVMTGDLPEMTEAGGEAEMTSPEMMAAHGGKEEVRSGVIICCH